MNKKLLIIGMIAVLAVLILFGCDRRVAPEETIVVDYARLTASRHTVNIYSSDDGSSQGGEAGKVTLVVEVKDENSVGIADIEVIFIKDSEKGRLLLDENKTDSYGVITANLEWFGDLGADQRDTIGITAVVQGYDMTLHDTIVFYSTLPGVPVHMLQFEDLGENTFIPLDTTDYPIRVRAISELNNPIENLKINFASNSGDIDPFAYTDIDGWAETKFTPESTGIVRITAVVDQETGSADSVSAYKNFTVPSGDPELMEFNQGSINLQIAGTGGNADAPLSVNVLDASGTIVENFPLELKVRFRITNPENVPGAYLGDNSGTTFTFANVITGVATTTIHSGTTSGTMGINASLYYLDQDSQELLPFPDADHVVESTTNTITISNGPPASIAVQLDEDGDEQDGQWRCWASASVRDIYNNPVPDSTAVLFSISNESASINAFGFTYNENDNNIKNHGVAYTKLFYDSQHTNDTITIIAKAVNNLGEEIVGVLKKKLPVQNPNLNITGEVATLKFYFPPNQNGMPDCTPNNWDQFDNVLLTVTLEDGFENLIDNSPVHLNVTQGYGIISEQPFTGTTFPQWEQFENEPDDVTGTEGLGTCTKYLSVRLADVLQQPDSPGWGDQRQVTVEVTSPDWEGNDASVDISVQILPE